MPTINSVGRMDNAKIVVELFITSDSNRALQISKYLDKELKNSLIASMRILHNLYVA